MLPRSTSHWPTSPPLAPAEHLPRSAGLPSTRWHFRPGTWWRRSAWPLNWLRPVILSRLRQGISMGIPMEYSWDIHEIFMEYSWNIHGIFMRYSWDIHGIFMGYSWNIHGIFMGYSWDMDVNWGILPTDIWVCPWVRDFSPIFMAGWIGKSVINHKGYSIFWTNQRKAWSTIHSLYCWFLGVPILGECIKAWKKSCRPDGGTLPK